MELKTKPTKKELAYFESFTLGLIKRKIVDWVVIKKVITWSKYEQIK